MEVSFPLRRDSHLHGPRALSHLLAAPATNHLENPRGPHAPGGIQPSLGRSGPDHLGCLAGDLPAGSPPDSMVLPWLAFGVRRGVPSGSTNIQEGGKTRDGSGDCSPLYDPGGHHRSPPWPLLLLPSGLLSRQSPGNRGFLEGIQGACQSWWSRRNPGVSIHLQSPASQPTLPLVGGPVGGPDSPGRILHPHGESHELRDSGPTHGRGLGHGIHPNRSRTAAPSPAV